LNTTNAGLERIRSEVIELKNHVADEEDLIDLEKSFSSSISRIFLAT